LVNWLSERRNSISTIWSPARQRSWLNEFREIGWPHNVDFEKSDWVKNTKPVLSCR